MSQKIYFSILRLDHPELKSYWENFALPFRQGMTVTAALRHIRRFPVNINGKSVPAVVFQDDCVGAGCTSCLFVINGVPRLGCQTQVQELSQPVSVEPLAKFPVVRDLVVNKKRLREARGAMQSWNELEGILSGSFFERQSQSVSQNLLRLNSCTSCGACLEACPQVGKKSAYLGVQALSRVALFASTPVGQLQMPSRPDSLNGPLGLDGCDQSQNCVRACPQKIPLTESLATLSKKSFLYNIFK